MEGKKSSVVYVGHLPHGFQEPQMRDYFTQFGNIRRLRMSRSKKSARSKGYAFIEFNDPDVAKLAAESMNNYLMFEKVLKCHVMTPDKIHKHLFKGCNQHFTPSKCANVTARQMNSLKTEKGTEKQQKRMIATLRKKNKQLQKLGLNYSIAIPGRKQRQRLAAEGEVVRKRKEGSRMKKRQKLVSPAAEESNYSMVVDSSDDEISFKTPPKSVRKSARLSAPKLPDETEQIEAEKSPRTGKNVLKQVVDEEGVAKQSFPASKASVQVKTKTKKRKSSRYFSEN